MSKRWYVLRGIKLPSGEVPSGKYLTEKQVKEIPEGHIGVLVRGVRLYDTAGDYDISWRERNKHFLRLRCLREINTKESAKLHELVVERFANGREVMFAGPREKALAEEIRENRAMKLADKADADAKEAKAAAKKAKKAEADSAKEAQDLADKKAKEAEELGKSADVKKARARKAARSKAEAKKVAKAEAEAAEKEASKADAEAKKKAAEATAKKKEAAKKKAAAKEETGLEGILD